MCAAIEGFSTHIPYFTVICVPYFTDEIAYFTNEISNNSILKEEAPGRKPTKILKPDRLPP